MQSNCAIFLKILSKNKEAQPVSVSMVWEPFHLYIRTKFHIYSTTHIVLLIIVSCLFQMMIRQLCMWPCLYLCVLFFWS